MARFEVEERLALEQHLRECGQCRSAYDEYLSSRPGAQADRDGARLLPWSPTEARRHRFLEAASRQGLTFSPDAIAPEPDATPGEPEPDSRRSRVTIPWRWAAAAALILCAAGTGLFYIRAEPEPDRALARLVRENPEQENRLQADRIREDRIREDRIQEDRIQDDTVVRDRGAADQPPAQSARMVALAELERTRAEIAGAGTRIAALERSLREASAKLSALQAEAGRAATDGETLRAKVRDAEERVGALAAERDRLIEQRAADATFMAVQSARIDRLSEQLREREQVLARQQELLGADRDIRDLMGARNLHVIDVFDVDGRGKTRRSFGRAFYTEGKSLIFYAFDLAGRNAQRASFQAWGQRTADERSTQSLGIFYSDDKAQNRWILKFDDPKVLNQIDSVFVTIEPPGGSTRPSGQKLLYAYLRNGPNHP